MAHDRFVYWKNEAPAQEKVQEEIVNFLGGIGSVEWTGDRFLVLLPGETLGEWRGDTFLDGSNFERRYFEVWLDPKGKSLDVITRHADEFTVGVADRFASLTARRWYGTLERDA